LIISDLWIVHDAVKLVICLAQSRPFEKMLERGYLPSMVPISGYTLKDHDGQSSGAVSFALNQRMDSFGTLPRAS
jgi:hypothetical protein